MKKLLFKAIKHATFWTILGVVVVCILAYGVSWIATCGLIKLITMCFGWTFSWLWATGIWLILCVLESTFKSASK